MNREQKALDNIRFYCGHANCDGYLNPKVFEELNVIQELVDKATPKKVIIKKYGDFNIGDYYCPHCNQQINEEFEPKYCKDCGKALDWS